VATRQGGRTWSRRTHLPPAEAARWQAQARVADQADLLQKIRELEERAARRDLTIKALRSCISDLETLLRAYGHAI